MSEQMDWEAISGDFLDMLLYGETEEALALTRETLDKGVPPVEFFERCVTPALGEVGDKFEALEIFIPELIDAAEIVQQINEEIINPAIESSSAEIGRAHV